MHATNPLYKVDGWKNTLKKSSENSKTAIFCKLNPFEHHSYTPLEKQKNIVIAQTTLCGTLDKLVEDILKIRVTQNVPDLCENFKSLPTASTFVIDS